MVSENKNSENPVDEEILSIDLDNLELPDIPDLDLNEDSSLNFDFDHVSDQGLEEIPIDVEQMQEDQQNQEDLDLLPLEDTLPTSEDDLTLNAEELDHNLELDNLQQNDLNELEVSENIDLEEKNLSEDSKIEPIEIDFDNEVPMIEDFQENYKSDVNESYDVDESISLSENELNDILEDQISETTSLEKEDVLKIEDNELAEKIISDSEPTEDETQEETYIPTLSEVGIEEETISLTPEELQSIVSSENLGELSEELSEEVEEGQSSISEQELKEIEIPEPIFEDETETISLTDDELHNIIGDVTSEEISEPPTIPEPEIYDITEKKFDREKLTDDLYKETGLKKEELKKMISYLDSLFDKLPDDVIREFSKSEYFNLYKKVIETLEIYPKE